MTTRRIAAMVVLGSLAVLASACGGDDDSTSNTNAPPPATQAPDGNSTEPGADTDSEPQTITVAFNSTSTWPEPKATLTAAKGPFEAANPGVTIELQEEVAADDAFITKLELRLQAGNDLPDVIMIPPERADGWAAAGYVMPIEDRLANWPDWQAQFPQAIRDGAVQIDGHTYFVPLAANNIGIWYNRDVFEEAGLPREWSPASWQDLIDAADAIKANVPGAIPMHLYAGKASGAIDNVGKTFLPLLYGTGETLYDGATGKWQPAGEGFLDSMTFIQDAYGSGLTADEADVLSPDVWALIGPWMKESELGFVPDGNWMSFAWVEGGAYEWPEWGDVLGVAAFPGQFDEGDNRVTLAYKGAGFGIVAGSDSPNLAMKFIEFASSKESSLAYSLSSGQLAVRTDVAADPAYQNRPTVEAFSGLLKYAHYLPVTEEAVKVNDFLSGTIEKVAFGKMSPQEAVDSWNSEMPGTVGKELWAG